MEEQNNQTQHGGKREGAGRKAIGETRKVSLTLPHERWDAIEDLCKEHNLTQSKILREIIGENIKTSFVPLEEKAAPKNVFVVLRITGIYPPEIWKVYEKESAAKKYIEENKWSEFVYEKQTLFK